MMKSILTKWLPLAVVVLLIAGAGYLAVADVNVSQTTVEKNIPNDRFYR